MDKIHPGVPLSKVPAGKPPPGLKSNFVDPPSLANAIVAVNVVFLALMLIAVTIRIYTKGILLHSLWWDDWTALLAAAGSIAHTGVSIQQTNHGLGRHIWDIPLSYLTGNDIQVLHADAIISHPTYLFFKLSALLLYFRLFSVNGQLRYWIWFGIILQFIGYTAFLGQAIGLIVECSSAEAAQTKQFCLDNWKATYAQSIFSVITDFYVLVLPIPIVLGLHMSVRRKIGVMVIFLTGLLACAASLTRCIISIQKLHSEDTLYSGGEVTIYSAVEINVGIIAGALTTLPPFLSKSGALSFGQSAMSSLRSRLLGRSKSSITSRKSDNSDGAKGRMQMQRDDGSSLESDRKADGEKVAGIVRTDDYEVNAYRRSDVYAPV